MSNPRDWHTVTDAGGWAVGVAWARDEQGSWLLPKHTLGWGVIDWAYDHLLTPDGARAGEPWLYTPEQTRIVLWWYAVDDNGKFIYRDGSLRRMKGWGKDPFAASLAWAEALGPVRFGGWGEDGQPIGVPVFAPWVQIAGVSEEATKNTTESLRPMIGGKAGARRLGVDLGIQITYLPNGRLEVVTKSPDTMEGNRPSFVVRGETHLWTAIQGGAKLAEAIKRNLAKTGGRGLSLTNAHEPGTGSVAEADFALWEAQASGRTVLSDVLYDSLEAPPETRLNDPGSLRRGLVAAAGDSLWVPVDRLVDEILDVRTSPSMSRRFYLNQLRAAQDALFEPEAWSACEVAGAELVDGESVVLAFDGSRNDDHTGLVACRVSDGCLFVLGHWDPAEFGGEIPRRAVDAAVAAAFERFNVVGLWADVLFWESYVDAWAERYGSSLALWAGPKSGKRAHPVAFDMRSRTKELSEATERFVADVAEGEVRHDGDLRLARHVANARRAVNRYGFSVRKVSPDSSKKIDLAVCAIVARMMRQIVLASGMSYQKKSYSSFSF